MSIITIGLRLFPAEFLWVPSGFSISSVHCHNNIALSTDFKFRFQNFLKPGKGINLTTMI